MTIAAYISESESRVYMASDSFSTTKKQNTTETGIIRIPEERPQMLLGFSGHPLVIQSIQSGSIFPPKNSEWKSMLSFVIDNLRPNLEHLGKDFELLIAYDQKIFHVGYDFSLTEIKGNYNAIGTGRDYAIGSLYATETNHMINAKDKLTVAIESAIKYDIGSGGEINFEYI
jgi:hypothetical protein